MEMLRRSELRFLFIRVIQRAPCFQKGTINIVFSQNSWHLNSGPIRFCGTPPCTGNAPNRFSLGIIQCFYFIIRFSSQTGTESGISFEAIETIIKLPIAPVVRNVSKFFETTGPIGAIRTIMGKPGFDDLTTLVISIVSQRPLGLCIAPNSGQIDTQLKVSSARIVITKQR